MNIETTSISYDRMKEQIDREISIYLEKNSVTDPLLMPAVSYEQGTTKISFPLPMVSELLLPSFIKIIKNHIANIRIHSFEEGYYAFQALNSNLFNTENILNNLKIECIDRSSSSRIELAKKGHLSQEEINVCIELFKKAYSSVKDDPVVRLKRLGASVVSDNEEITWDYIAGYDGVKRTLRESIILPLKNPAIYDSIARKTRKVFESNRPRAAPDQLSKDPSYLLPSIF